MQISKEKIIKGIMELSNYYIDIDKKIQRAGELESMVESWFLSFQEMDFDYSEANDDFVKAIRIISAKSKYVPTLYDIIEEMRTIYKGRINQEKMNFNVEVSNLSDLCGIKIIGNMDRTISNYKRLTQKYTTEQLKEMIIEKIGNKNELAITLENCLKEIIGE